MRKFLQILTVLCVFTIISGSIVFAANWRGFRGTRRDGKSPDTGLLQKWPQSGPKLLWKTTSLGEGYSSPAVVDGIAYITGVESGSLTIYAFDVKSGKLKWKKAHGSGWTNSRYYPGSRATPTISRGLLYILSGKGKIGCYKASNGSRVWSADMSDFGGRAPHWGFAESVLITRNYAIITPGGRDCVVALDRETGKPAWKSRANGGSAHYSSLIIFEYKGATMIVGGNRKGLFAVDPNNGKPLWDVDFATNNTANCPTPAFSDGYVFWANGYNKGGICVKLDVNGGKVRAREAWRTRKMVCHHGGYIIHEGYIYGNHQSSWVCLDLKSGDVKWEGRGVGKGSVTYADGMLYTFGENRGKVGLVKATPDSFIEAGQFSVKGSGKSWAYPVIINGNLFLRYDSNLYCFDVKK